MARQPGRTTYPPPLARPGDGGSVTTVVRGRRSRRSRLLTAKVVGGLLVAVLPVGLDATTEGAGLTAVWEAASWRDAAPSPDADEVAPVIRSSAPAVAVAESAPPGSGRPAPAPAPAPAAPAGGAGPGEVVAGTSAQSPAEQGGTPPPAEEPVAAAARPAAGPVPTSADTVAASGETTMVDGVRYRVQSPLRPWSVQVSPSSNYTRFELRAGDRWANDVERFPDGRQRAKLRGEDRYAPRTDIWIAYSLRWSGDIPATWGLITSLHSALEPGESKGKPGPFTVSVARGKLTLFTRSDTQALTTSKEDAVPRFEMPLPAEGEWHDVVYRVRLDPYGDGRVSFWFDGEQRYDSGAIPIGYNDAVGPYFKYGLYRGMSDLTTVMEFANVEVGTRSLQDRVSAPRPVPA